IRDFHVTGVQTCALPISEVPLVKARLIIEAGARLDGERPGLATFTANMLDEGAGERDAFEIAEQLEYLGADLSTNASWDATTIRSEERRVGKERRRRGCR